MKISFLKWRQFANWSSPWGSAPTWGHSDSSLLHSSQGMWQTVRECHFQSGPNQSPVCSHTIPEFRDITVGIVTINLWALYLSHFRTLWAQTNRPILPEASHDSKMWKSEVVGKSYQGACCAHDDTACFWIFTESGIVLWHNRLLNTIGGKFHSESWACNLRPGTWRRWLSARLRKHLVCTLRIGTWWQNLQTSWRGTSSALCVVFVTESDIFSLLRTVAYGIRNKSRSKVFVRY